MFLHHYLSFLLFYSHFDSLPDNADSLRCIQPTFFSVLSLAITLNSINIRSLFITPIFHFCIYLYIWKQENIENKLEIEIAFGRKCHRVVIKLILFDKKFASILNSTTPSTYFAAHGVRKNRYTFVTGYRWSVDSNINFESEQRVRTDDKMTRDSRKRERQGEGTKNTKTRG